MKLLHLARKEAARALFPPAFRKALGGLGEFELVENLADTGADDLLRRIQECDVLLTGWGCCAVPREVAASPGRLRYVCHLTGTLAGAVPIEVVDSPIAVTNWGDAPAHGVAEAALALLLAVLKNFRWQVRAKETGHWLPPAEIMAQSGTIEDLRLGIYGGGVIGQRFIELCRPFGPRMALYDPYLDVTPEGVERASDLAALFACSDAVAIHAGLTPETRGSVTAELLARLPDGGIVINTARGDIIDQGALFAELERGRLRAGLDVLAGPDHLEPDHPARHWPNLVLTGHKAANSDWKPRPEDADRLARYHHVALDNLRRFRDGEPLRFRVDPLRLSRST